jgi:hypothetical protein
VASSIQRRVKIAAAIALLAVAAGGFLVLRSGAPPDASAAARPRATESHGRSTPEPAVAAEEHVPAPAAQRTDVLAAEWIDAGQGAIGPVVEGTIVVTDPDGAQHTEEDGLFAPLFIDGVDSDSGDATAASGATPRRIAVKRGRFRFDARGATVMGVEEAELGGWAAAVGKNFDLTSGEPLHVTALWIPDVQLHVVDAETRRELTDVSVCAAFGAAASLEHPGLPDRPAIVAENERSPFHLRSSSSVVRSIASDTFWIRARERAWKRERIDLQHERKHEVALGPAGALAVVVTEPADAAPLDRGVLPRVRLRHADKDAGPPICDVTAEAGEFELDGLPPGEVIAAIEIGDVFWMPFVLSRSAVTIRAGATERVALSLDAAKVPKPTRLAGTAFVPLAWGDCEMTIDVFPQNLRGGTRDDERRSTRIALEPIPNRPGWHRWSISPILPATYHLRVQHAGFETQVDVPENGREDATLTLPEPALLQVRVVDAATQKDVEVSELVWMFTDSHNPEKTELTAETGTGRCTGAVRPGRGKIFPSSRRSSEPLLLDSGEEFEVRTGENEIVVHADPPCGVDLVASIDAEPDESFTIQWSRSGDGPFDHFSRVVEIRNGRTRIGLPGPGQYRFTRYRRSDQTVEFLFDADVRKGEFVEKRITLSR